MRWSQAEYILKGVFLGLLAYAALQEPDWPRTGLLALYLAGGLAAGLLAALLLAIFRDQIRLTGRLLSLVLFLILENPTLVYAGIIGGLFAGVVAIRPPAPADDAVAHAPHPTGLLVICVGFGALIGVAMGELRRIGPAMWRLGAALATACVLVGAALYSIEQNPDYIANPRMFGVHILLGLPFFYLLVFASEADESEAEIAALCAAMAVGVWLARPSENLPAVTLLIPAALYFLYTRSVMPALRVTKHTLRGYSYFRMGQVRPALRSFRRALQLDPNNQVAVTGLARVHGGIDARQVANDPETLAMLDLDLCLNRAAKLLWRQDVGPHQLDEVGHLLELVAARQTTRWPEVEYWRTIADMRAKKIDDAAARLEKLLDPAAWDGDQSPSRWEVLLPAWELALLRSHDLAARVGQPQLSLPGRSMEAIAAAERGLAHDPKDADAWDLKRRLYDGLTLTEFQARPPARGEFDPVYARELGLARIGDAARWRRGIEYLQMAALSYPEQAPSTYVQIAQTFERAGEPGNARKAYEFLEQIGREFGPKHFPAEEKAVFFGVVKRMADEAAARGDERAAIGHLILFAEYERSGLETLRQLAEMHERLGDALAALKFTDRALVYNPSDPDLLARKDRYYFSVPPDQVKQLPEAVRNSLDANYCLNKARQILAGRATDPETAEWALHLADLACILKPKSYEARYLAARARLWKGERDEALRRLEDLRDARPEKFEANSDEDAWYRLNQTLGDLYLNEYHRADLAVGCYLEFRKSSKSGADTLYKLGQAYESLGDVPHAAQFYEQVTSYTEHPRYYDAQEALRRVKGG